MNKEVKNPTSIISNKNIEDCIYNIRGQQVMLDSDIALFFGVETKRLNEQMKRNISRFPKDFCFILTNEEINIVLRSHFATSNGLSSKRRYNPYVYTEHGIIALAGVLKSDIADKMSIQIARKFIQMRKFMLENGELLLSLAKIQNRQLEFENETNNKFELVFRSIEKLDLPKTALFYNNQWFDAFDYIVGIVKQAKKSIILIDPYCDSSALSFFKYKNRGVKLLICNSSKSKIDREEIVRFESEYGPVELTKRDDIHDRFLVIDEQECYSLGASLNYAGRKLFVINKIEDSRVVKQIIRIPIVK